MQGFFFISHPSRFTWNISLVPTAFHVECTPVPSRKPSHPLRGSSPGGRALGKLYSFVSLPLWVAKRHEGLE